MSSGHVDQHGPPVAVRTRRHLCLASWRATKCTGNAGFPRNMILDLRCLRTLPLGTLAKPQGGSIGVMLISAISAPARSETGCHMRPSWRYRTGPACWQQKGRFAKRPYIVRWGLSKRPFDRPCDLYSAIFRSTADVLPFLPVSSSNETFWPSFRSVMPAA